MVSSYNMSLNNRSNRHPFFSGKTSNKDVNCLVGRIFSAFIWTIYGSSKTLWIAIYPFEQFLKIALDILQFSHQKRSHKDVYILRSWKVSIVDIPSIQCTKRYNCCHVILPNNCNGFLKTDNRTANATFVCQICILSDANQTSRSTWPIKEETNRSPTNVSQVNLKQRKSRMKKELLTTGLTEKSIHKLFFTQISLRITPSVTNQKKFHQKIAWWVL